MKDMYVVNLYCMRKYGLTFASCGDYYCLNINSYERRHISLDIFLKLIEYDRASEETSGRAWRNEFFLHFAKIVTTLVSWRAGARDEMLLRK